MNIKLFVMDVDGTMTDGKIYIGNSGEIFKSFDVKDGYGIHSILPSKNIFPVVLTGRKSDIVKNRCDELEIPYVIQGSKNKVVDLELLMNKLGLGWENVACVGDDLNDLNIIRKAEWSACPNDAVDEIKKECDFVASKVGGRGAIRESIEALMLLVDNINV